MAQEGGILDTGRVLAQLGYYRIGTMSALVHLQTFPVGQAMSALPLEADNDRFMGTRPSA